MSLCVFGQDPNSNPEPNPTKPYLLTLTTVAFRPQSKDILQKAVDECIKMSSIGDCSEAPHGRIGDWDVSAVTNMEYMFSREFDFNQDLSKWDVSAVTNMGFMFSDASAFNQDLSKWDVSAVTNMEYMFQDTAAFKRELCGDAWVKSKADKKNMFKGSLGRVCKTAKRAAGGDCGFKVTRGSSASTCVCVCVCVRVCVRVCVCVCVCTLCW